MPGLVGLVRGCFGGLGGEERAEGVVGAKGARLFLFGFGEVKKKCEIFDAMKKRISPSSTKKARKDSEFFHLPNCVYARLG